MPSYTMPRPRFTASDLDDEKQRRKIISWLIQLDEQLRFLMNNLDEENLSEGLSTAIERVGSAIQFTAQDEENLRSAMSTIQLLPQQITIAVQEAVEQLDPTGTADELITTGSEIILTALMAKITTPEFIVSILKSGTQQTALQIDESGAVMDYLSVMKKLTAPNMAEKADIPDGLLIVDNNSGEGHYATLQAALNELNGKTIMEPVTVSIRKDLNELVVLENTTGADINIYSYNTTLRGGIILDSCDNEITLDNLTMLRQGNSGGFVIGRCGYVSMSGVTIDGQGMSTALTINTGSKVRLDGVGLYNATNLIELGALSELHASNCQGSGTYYLESNGGRWTWEGTRPAGSYNETGASLKNDQSTGASAGTAPTPASGTITKTALQSISTGTYSGGAYVGSGLKQGMENGSSYMGVMTFDTSGIPASATVTSAFLTIKRSAEGGQSGAALARLYKLTSANPPTKGDYCDLNYYQPGEKKIAHISDNALITPGGYTYLALDPDDSAQLAGRSYSANAAVFEATGDDRPELTVYYT